MKRNVIIFKAILIHFFFIVSCKNEFTLNDKFQKNNEIAYQYLDSLNSLPKADLIKIHTRGCVNNCWPLKTAIKVFSFEKTINDKGYIIYWDYEYYKYKMTKRDNFLEGQ